MLDYLYDGTYEGFLTCVYAHYYQEKAAGVYPADEYQASLLHGCRFIKTDPEQADRVFRAIPIKISQLALDRSYLLYLSNHPDKASLAFRYLCLGFKVGPSLNSRHSHPLVYEVQQTAGKVQTEAHRLLGLLRFSVLHSPVAGKEEEILYGRVEPDHDVLELLGDHFADRFRSQPFIIHDLRRGKALFSSQNQWTISSLDATRLPDYAADEQAWRALWRNYFDAIAIRERISSKRQRRFIPVRYWKNLTEMDLCQYSDDLST